MDKKQEKVDINRVEDWGHLENPDAHLAAFGVRLADNRSRDFGVFGDRMTLIGEKKVAIRLNKFVVSKKVLNLIKKNTHFTWDRADGSFETDLVMGKNLKVHIKAVCSGEYCRVAAYADKVEGTENGQ